MSGNVYTTGFKELDKALADLEPKVQRKYGKTALNNSLKIVEAEYKERVPVRTGAMRDAIVRRTPKGKRGELKRTLMITRASLAKSTTKKAIAGIRSAGKAALSLELAALRGNRSLGKEERARTRALLRSSQRDKTKSEIEGVGSFSDQDFYPAFVELGTSTEPGKSPMRGALYDSANRIRQEFVKQLRQLVASGGK